MAEDGDALEGPAGSRSFGAVLVDYSVEEEWVGVRTEESSFALPFQQIGRLTVLRDRRKPNWRMVKRYWLLGGAIAGFSGLIAIPMSDECSGWVCISDQDATIGLGLSLGIGMGLVGTVGGLFGTEEIWERIPLPGAGPSILFSQSGRMGIGFSIHVGS
jgi:hypothetical protein